MLIYDDAFVSWSICPASKYIYSFNLSYLLCQRQQFMLDFSLRPSLEQYAVEN